MGAKYLIGAGFGYAVAKLDGVSQKEDKLVVQENGTYVPFEDYANTILQLNEAKVTMSSLIAINAELNASLKDENLDVTTRTVYEEEIKNLESQYDLLLRYVERNIEGFTPEIAVGEFTVDGVHINPNLTFDRDKKEHNLYVDSNSCIAIRGVKSHATPVQYYKAGEIGYLKSTGTPSENEKHFSVTTNWNNVSFRISGSNIYRSNVKSLTSNDKFIPWLMIEFDKSIDFRSMVNELAVGSVYDNNWVSPHASMMNTMDFIVYRSNVLLIRPTIGNLAKNNWGVNVGPIKLWSSGRVIPLLVKSCAVLNLPIGGTHYYNSQLEMGFNALADALCVPKII